MENFEYNEDYHGLLENCPKCSRYYDDIDFDYQSCSKFGWDAVKSRYDKPRTPKESDYLNGEADILTGEWN